MWTGRCWCKRCAETHREWLFREERQNGGDAHMALESEEMVVPFHLFLPFLRFQSCLETSRSL